MGDQWSFKPDDKYKSTHQLIQLLVDIVGKGGNFLLNVGPQPDGQLPAMTLVRLKEIGDWMKVNGEAIYGTRPIAPYKDGQVVFTRNNQTVYAIYLIRNESGSLPAQIKFRVLSPPSDSQVYVLGVKKPLAWRIESSGGITIDLPPAVRKSPPCQHAITPKLEIMEPQ